MALPTLFTQIGLDHFIGEDAGDVRLDGDLMPGILQSLTVEGGLRLDTAEMVSGARRSQPLGFSTLRARFVLALSTEAPDLVTGFLGSADADGEHTCYGKAAALENLFRAVDSAGNPLKRRLTNLHANARGIDEVWFSGLITSEAQNDVITATLILAQAETPSFAELKSPGLTVGGVTLDLPDEVAL